MKNNFNLNAQQDIYCTKKHVKLNILFQVIFHAVLRFFGLYHYFASPNQKATNEVHEVQKATNWTSF